MHDGLGLEHHGRRRNAGDGVERLDDPVGLGQILAVGAEALPDEGHRVQAQDLDALVGEEQHLFHHAVEDHRVLVVQVPLVGVEGGPHPLLDAGAVGEGAGVVLGEDLGHGALVGVGHLAVGVHSIVGLVLPVTGEGLPCPLVLIRGVVEHEVQGE